MRLLAARIWSATSIRKCASRLALSASTLRNSTGLARFLRALQTCCSLRKHVCVPQGLRQRLSLRKGWKTKCRKLSSFRGTNCRASCAACRTIGRSSRTCSNARSCVELHSIDMHLMRVHLELPPLVALVPTEARLRHPLPFSFELHAVGSSNRASRSAAPSALSEHSHSERRLRRERARLAENQQSDLRNRKLPPLKDPRRDTIGAKAQPDLAPSRNQGAACLRESGSL